MLKHYSDNEKKYPELMALWRNASKIFLTYAFIFGPWELDLKKKKKDEQSKNDSLEYLLDLGEKKKCTDNDI